MISIHVILMMISIHVIIITISIHVIIIVISTMDVAAPEERKKQTKKSVSHLQTDLATSQPILSIMTNQLYPPVADH